MQTTLPIHYILTIITAVPKMLTETVHYEMRARECEYRLFTGTSSNPGCRG